MPARYSALTTPRPAAATATPPAAMIVTKTLPARCRSASRIRAKPATGASTKRPSSRLQMCTRKRACCAPTATADTKCTAMASSITACLRHQRSIPNALTATMAAPHPQHPIPGLTPSTVTIWPATPAICPHPSLAITAILRRCWIVMRRRPLRDLRTSSSY